MSPPFIVAVSSLYSRGKILEEITLSRNNCLSKDRKGGKVKSFLIRIYDTLERGSPGFVGTELPSHKLPKKSLFPLQVWRDGGGVLCWVLGARQCSGPGAVQARLSSVFWPWHACAVAAWSYTTLTLVQLYPILITAPCALSLRSHSSSTPRPGPAGQIVQDRLQSSDFVVAVLLRSVVVKCCCDGRQPRHQDEGRDAGQGGHGQDLPGGEVP